MQIFWTSDTEIVSSNLIRAFFLTDIPDANLQLHLKPEPEQIHDKQSRSWA